MIASLRCFLKEREQLSRRLDVCMVTDVRLAQPSSSFLEICFVLIRHCAGREVSVFALGLNPKGDGVGEGEHVGNLATQGTGKSFLWEGGDK